MITGKSVLICLSFFNADMNSSKFKKSPPFRSALIGQLASSGISGYSAIVVVVIVMTPMINDLAARFD